MTLHEAIEQILVQNKTAMRPTEIADTINKTKLYQKKDGSPIKSSQIGARVRNYPHLFINENGLIRLVSRTGIQQNNQLRQKSTIKAASEILDPDLLVKMLMNEKNYKSTAVIETLVPDQTGIYCIRVKDITLLPTVFSTALKERNHNIIYLGIASMSLKKRLLGQELRSKGHGTFFRSLGAMLGYLPIKGSLISKANQNNYKFSAIDTESIIEWINSNLMVNWVVCSTESLSLEAGLIKQYLPLLNIQGNPKALEELILLRNNCKQVARG